MFSSLRGLHRIIGALVALFVIVLSVTGIMLNHSQSLGLDKRNVSNPWVLSQYQLSNIQFDSAYPVGRKLVSQFGKYLFVNTQQVGESNLPLMGAMRTDAMLVLAFRDRILLLTSAGEQIEWLGAAAGVPAGIQKLGEYHGEPVLQTAAGMWRSDDLLDQWEKLELQGVRWINKAQMNAASQAKIKQQFRGASVPAEQLVLDVHNGRILGGMGGVLLDLVAIMLLLLAFSGLWMWVKRLLR